MSPSPLDSAAHLPQSAVCLTGTLRPHTTGAASSRTLFQGEQQLIIRQLCLHQHAAAALQIDMQCRGAHCRFSAGLQAKSLSQWTTSTLVSHSLRNIMVGATAQIEEARPHRCGLACCFLKGSSPTPGPSGVFIYVCVMGCAGRCLGGYGGRPVVGGTSLAAECTDACDPVHKWQHLLWPCSNSCSGKDPSPTAPLKPTFPIAPSNQTLSGGEPCVGKIVEGPAASRLEATQPSEQQPQSGSAEQHAASPAPQAPAAANKTAAGAHATASTGDGLAADAAEQQAASPEKRSAAAAAAPHVSTRAEANTGGTQAARAPAPDVSALEQQVQQQAGEIARLQAQAALIPGL